MQITAKGIIRRSHYFAGMVGDSGLGEHRWDWWSKNAGSRIDYGFIGLVRIDPGDTNARVISTIACNGAVRYGGRDDRRRE